MKIVEKIRLLKLRCYRLFILKNMKKIKALASLFAVSGIFLLSGCVESDVKPVNTNFTHIDRPDLTEQTFVKSDGTVVKLQTSSTQSVKDKNANIRTNQTFESVKNSTLVIEAGTTEITGYIKESTITLKKGAVLKTPYVKKSKIIVEEGGDLQILSRLKDSEIILANIENFSVRPSDLDDNSKISEE